MLEKSISEQKEKEHSLPKTDGFVSRHYIYEIVQYRNTSNTAGYI